MSSPNAEITQSDQESFAATLQSYVSGLGLTAGDVIHVVVPSLSVALTQTVLTDNTATWSALATGVTALYSALSLRAGRSPDSAISAAMGASLVLGGAANSLYEPANTANSAFLIANGIQAVVAAVRTPEGADEGPLLPTREKAD